MISINLMILEKHLELQDRHVQRFCLTWSLYTNTADTLSDQRGDHCELPVYIYSGMGPFKNGICIRIEFAFTFANFHEIENARKPQP